MTVNDGASPLAEAAACVEELTAAAFALAAVAAALRADDPAALTDEHGVVLAELGMVVPRDTGGWNFAPAITELGPTIRRNLAQRLTVTLTRAAAAAEGRFSWAEQDLDVKVELGRMSGIAGGMFVTVLAPYLGELADRLTAPEAAALDVGTGVGEIAVAMAEAAPALHVVGIDVLDEVLDVARATVAGRGLADRVTLRHQDVATLSDVSAYDLVYLPAYFLPEESLSAALPRIHRALRPGGWLVVAAHEAPRRPLSRAVDAWRQVAAGCCTWDAAETTRRVQSAGFGRVQALMPNPLLPGVVVGTVER